MLVCEGWSLPKKSEQNWTSGKMGPSQALSRGGGGLEGVRPAGRARSRIEVSARDVGLLRGARRLREGSRDVRVLARPCFAICPHLSPTFSYLSYVFLLFPTFSCFL